MAVASGFEHAPRTLRKWGAHEMMCGNLRILTSMKRSRVRARPSSYIYLKGWWGSVRVNGEQKPNATHLSVGALGRLRRCGDGRAFGPDGPHGQWKRSPGAYLTCLSNPLSIPTCY